MATATHLPISVYEYLHTSYRPDCDYVDGAIEERHLGELDHSEVQRALLLWLSQYGHEWGVEIYPEIRIQVNATRFRVADLCLVARTAPREQIIQTPPFAVIEILSPEDRVNRYQQRLEDYREMGIQYIWVVDPATRKGFDCSTGNWVEASQFSISDSQWSLNLEQVFAEIDKSRQH